MNESAPQGALLRPGMRPGPEQEEFMPQEKTNAMRILDRAKASYLVHTYEGGALSGVAVAASLGEDPGRVYKTLVTVGSPRRYYVFIIPVAAELDLKKAARAAGEKSVDMLPLKELFPLTGYVHGGCSPLGMKKAFPTFFHFRQRREGGRADRGGVLRPCAPDGRNVCGSCQGKLTVSVCRGGQPGSVSIGNRERRAISLRFLFSGEGRQSRRPRIYSADRSSSRHSRANVSRRGSFLVVMYCVIISGDTPTLLAISARVSGQAVNSSLSRCLMSSSIGWPPYVFLQLITNGYFLIDK